jgi:hypothetical protein
METHIMPTCPNCKHIWKIQRKKPDYKVNFNYETAKFEGLNGELIIWAEKFPAINIDAEIRKAEAWCYDHPKNRKSDWKLFLGKWLMRSQDKAPTQTIKQSGTVIKDNIIRSIQECSTVPPLPESHKIPVYNMLKAMNMKWPDLHRKVRDHEIDIKEIEKILTV